MKYLFGINKYFYICESITNKKVEIMSTKTPQPPKPIHVSREQIQATKAFQNATKMIQILTLKRTSFRSIEHGVNVSVNIGLDKWENQTQASFTNREIVREIVETKNQNQ